MKEICKNCIYFAKDHEVCVNSESEHCADFVVKEDTCDSFSEKVK